MVIPNKKIKKRILVYSPDSFKIGSYADKYKNLKNEDIIFAYHKLIKEYLLDYELEEILAELNGPKKTKKKQTKKKKTKKKAKKKQTKKKQTKKKKTKKKKQKRSKTTSKRISR